MTVYVVVGHETLGGVESGDIAHKVVRLGFWELGEGGHRRDRHALWEEAAHGALGVVRAAAGRSMRRLQQGRGARMNANDIPSLIVLGILLIGIGAAGVIGYVHAMGAIERARQAPRPHEPPHSRYCDHEDGVWKCFDDCPWRAWKVELANRGLVPPGPPNLKVVK